MKNPLAKKITFTSILKFTLPTIIMMVFMALYTMVDGIFVSNLINENALSAINIVYPVVSIIVAIAIMFATGGSAVIATKMGNGKNDEARQNFTLIVIVGAIIGFLVMIVGFVFIDDIIPILGGNAVLFDYCREYLFILMLFAPFAVLQMLFQFFFVTAGKPNLGLITTIIGGVANVILDYVFIEFFHMGIAGAAVATGIGYCVPALYGLYYFSTHKKGSMYFVKPTLDWAVLGESCFNGSSEMVTNLATAVTTFLFNIMMLKYMGEDGVAAITIVLYAQFLLTAIYLGFSSGIAPMFSYNYGEENKEQLRRLFKISMSFILISSIVIYILSLLLCENIVTIFVKNQSAVFPIAINGFVLFAISYIFTGLNIFASSMFTAFSNGKVSAVISFLRTFAFILLGILFLPKLMDVNGIWLAVPFAEALTFIMAIAFIRRYKDRYSLWGEKMTK